MNFDAAYHIAFMAGCFILILLLLKILIYVHAQNNKLRQLEKRVKLIEEAEDKLLKENEKNHGKKSIL